MKSILIPTDFSELAQDAKEFGVGMAKISGAKIILLHVIEHPSASTFNTMGIVQADYDPMENIYIMKLMQAAKEKLQEDVDRKEYDDVDLHYEIVIGNPFAEIEQYVAKTKVDLIVMGTAGASGLTELIIGSNAEKVIRKAKCPVISLKSKVDVKSIKNIVFASDFVGKGMDNLIERVKELQTFFGAKLSLVRINTPNSFTTTRHDFDLMKKFADKHKLENYTLDIYNDSTEEEGIMYFAEDIGADLIALATNGRKGIWNLISGSIAEEIANHSKRPVWTLRITK